MRWSWSTGNPGSGQPAPDSPGIGGWGLSAIQIPRPGAGHRGRSGRSWRSSCMRLQILVPSAQTFILAPLNSSRSYGTIISHRYTTASPHPPPGGDRPARPRVGRAKSPQTQVIERMFEIESGILLIATGWTGGAHRGHRAPACMGQHRTLTASRRPGRPACATARRRSRERGDWRSYPSKAAVRTAANLEDLVHQGAQPVPLYVILDLESRNPATTDQLDIS